MANGDANNTAHIQHQIGNAYVGQDDRYVVSFLVGYSSDDAKCPEDAANWALELTRDAGSDGTIWFVYDRETGELARFEQSDFDITMRPCIERKYMGGCEKMSVYELSNRAIQDEDITVEIVRSMLESGKEHIYATGKEHREVFRIFDRDAAEKQSNELAV
jgi:hypothetical protein